jgi:hypothetical protein
MVDEMSRADALEVGELREEADRQSLVHEAVVDDEVGEAEQGHSRSDADQNRADRAVDELAAPDDEPHRDRDVEAREQIVSFESAESRSMMRLVDRPQRAVPDLAVEEACPWLHEAGHHDRAEDAERDRAHGSLPT